ncbi:MAG: hypothetical protein OXC07_07890 [Kistimonas sp.]|nr:hypothetical protein [Kistimonas sp.]
MPMTSTMAPASISSSFLPGSKPGVASSLSAKDNSGAFNRGVSLASPPGLSFLRRGAAAFGRAMTGAGHKVYSSCNSLSSYLSGAARGLSYGGTIGQYVGAAAGGVIGGTFGCVVGGPLVGATFAATGFGAGYLVGNLVGQSLGAVTVLALQKRAATKANIAQLQNANAELVARLSAARSPELASSAS